jgi:hypothetical protein
MGDVIVKVRPLFDVTYFSIKGTPHSIATSVSKTYVLSIISHAKYFTIAVATFDSVTGVILDIQHVDYHQLDLSINFETELQVVGSHSSAPLAIWIEKGKLKANILGTKYVTILPTEVLSLTVLI